MNLPPSNNPEKMSCFLECAHLTQPSYYDEVAPSDASTYLGKTSQQRLLSGVSARLPAPLHPCVKCRSVRKESAFSLLFFFPRTALPADGDVKFKKRQSESVP